MNINYNKQLPSQINQVPIANTAANPVVQTFLNLLETLKGPDAEIIKNLTDYAHNYFQNASDIANAIGNRAVTCSLSYKLPIFYLMDSIMKRVGGPFAECFARVS